MTMSGDPLVTESLAEVAEAAGHDHDMEAGSVGRLALNKEEFVDPFDIANTKNASMETLNRWRQAALVLNASRRFRYTLDLRGDEEKEQRRRMIRAHAQVIRAALLFKLAGQRAIGTYCLEIAFDHSFVLVSREQYHLFEMYRVNKSLISYELQLVFFFFFFCSAN